MIFFQYLYRTTIKILQVDNNVTRHLDDELTADNPWDVMILHYGGLDHIGHLMGPFSSPVPAKLTEMDNIVKRLYDYISDDVRAYFIQDMKRNMFRLFNSSLIIRSTSCNVCNMVENSRNKESLP